ncbi:neurofilament medium polypeptide-like [Papaver somniferum]|uniref:neurofilament medium polypeptide-like n=1 Tax=Papaver somniferum TaxID=3469 RepID=UPI000E6FEC74|nr:neurofilament medium polypeptide-like [Papaver somniferum]
MKFHSENNPGIVEAIRNKTKKKVEEDEPSLIPQEEEMGRIRIGLHEHLNKPIVYVLCLESGFDEEESGEEDVNEEKSGGNEGDGEESEDEGYGEESENEGDREESENELMKRYEKCKNKSKEEKFNNKSKEETLKNKDHKDVFHRMKPGTSVSMMKNWPLEGLESTVGEV